jgi:threonine dehydrogenase-like Zn-dependent dehydrogenase
MKALQFSISVPQFVALKAIGGVVRRAHYGGPLATVRLRDVPEPTLPSADWVKIRTLVCGFCGSDINLILLKESPMASPFTSFPCTLGHEVCGEVLEVGSSVDRVGAGDVVTIAPYLSCSTRGIDPVCRSCRMGRPASCENLAEGSLSPGMIHGLCHDVGGGFAPYLMAHKDQVFRLPQGVSAQEGAMVEPTAVALQAVLDNAPEEEDKVLVIGGGVIGNLVVQSIRALGIDCSITVAEPSVFHANMSSEAGADHLITDGAIAKHAEGITGARRYKPQIGKDILMGGFPKIFDTVGNSETLGTAMRALAVGGVLSVVGISKTVKLDPTPLWLKLQTIKGAYGCGYANVDGRREHVFETAADLIAQGKIRVGPMVTHTFRIEDYQRMIEINLDKCTHKAVKTIVGFT